MSSDEAGSPSTARLTDPLLLIDQRFAQLESLCELFIDGFGDAVASAASELQALEQQPRFTDSASVLRDRLRETAQGTASESVLAAIDLADVADAGALCLRGVQRELVLQALEEPGETIEHLILTAATQLLIDGCTELPAQSTDEDREELLSALLGVLSRLYELTRTDSESDPSELTDDAILDIAIGEYHFYRVTAERFERHPDTVPIPSIAPDLAVYGAAIAYDEYGVGIERAALLADEDHDEFRDLLESYGIDIDPE